MNRLESVLTRTCVWVASLLAAGPALAVDKHAEARARAVIEQAANDYAAQDYATAAARLDAAAHECGPSQCARSTKALVLRDLGTMQLLIGDEAAASNSFVDALALAPDLTLNPLYDKPNVRAAWNKEKEAVATSTAVAVEQPSGDFSHSPVSAQKPNTPLPVFVEFPGSEAPARVVVKYRGAQQSDWQHIDLDRMSGGWGGLIPCGDVTPGLMRYWVQGFDAGGEPAGSSGDPKHPYTVPIMMDVAGSAPHLPGVPAPRACEEGERGHGVEGEKPTSGAGQYSRWWVGVAGSIEFLSLPGGDDLCKLNSTTGRPANPSNAYCTNLDGTDFPSRSSNKAQNAALVQGQGGHLDGGLHSGDFRILLSADYALQPRLLVGGRLGYVFNAYPGEWAVTDGRAFGAKLHVEARATYLFSEDPLSHEGLAPMGFVATGLSEFDGSATRTVTLNSPGQPMPVSQSVNIWVTNGPWFLALGGGGRYQFTPRAAFMGALRLNTVFGGNGVMVTYGPEVGVAYGF
jgi:hypothetical protein